VSRVRVTSERFTVTLPTAVGHARRSWVMRESVRVTVVGDDGSAAEGEATPLPGYSSDDIDETAGALGELAPRLLAAAATPSQALVALAGWPAHLAAGRFALETALHAHIARARRAVVHEVLAPAPPPFVPVPLAALLPPEPLGGSVAAARAAADAGFAVVKMKLGRAGAWDEELRVLAEVRAALGPGVGLRLDVNGVWSADEADDKLAALAGLAPEMVEEPVTGEAWLDLGAPPSFPLAMDESLRHPEADRLFDEAARRRLCAVVMLKPMVLGGYQSCQKWAARARARGLDVAVSHTFDGPIALAAARALAIALRCTRACGLAAGESLAGWPGGAAFEPSATSLAP
jgi:L-alanine-DL-glutamate epimerase-like enolase superfamily enzyme